MLPVIQASLDIQGLLVRDISRGTGRVRKLAHRCPVHREAHINERDAGMRKSVRDDEERVHRSACERDTDAQRAFRLARPVRRVVPRPLEDLVDVDGITGLYSAGATGGALVPTVRRGIRWLDACDAVP